MHLHFPFSTVEVLWTLTFAAQLVLLVVLLGRERMARFPWFTTGIILVALRVLSARVLYSRLPALTFNAILIALADAGFLTGVMVLVEMARRSFRGAGRTAWLVWTVVLLAIGGVVIRYWGPWPAWKTIAANSKLAALLTMQLVAQKGEMLVGVLTILLTVLVVLFGRSFRAGWKSHPQRILIGLSTAAIAQLGVQAIWEIIVAHTRPTTREQYERVVGMHDKILNANSAVYILVLVWWIAVLWKDDPHAPPRAVAPAKNAAAPESNDAAGQLPADEASSPREADPAGH